MIERGDKTFSFGEFEVDARRRRLLKNGAAVRLNPKAFDLLLTLIERRGRVVHKEELLETVWANQFVEENNLTVHISALRKLFGEKQGDHKFIVTVPGKGYNFVAKVQSDNLEETEAARNGEKLPVQIFNPKGDSYTNEFGAWVSDFDERENLVGREREIAEIKNILLGSQTNLVTLTGAGGTGKTCLARAVAAEVKADFPDGVFFVELAAVTGAEFVAPTVMQTLGVTELSGKSPIETIKEFLRGRQTLLILDNFEQILSAAPLVKDFLAESSTLKVLVTSRAALRLGGECEFVVLPLDLPPLNAAFSVNRLNDFPAIALFCQRARAVKSNFTLTPENASYVADICRRLDGLPLAIELAAARIKLLAPKAILSRLENSLNLLTGGAKDLPSRQRTMRGAIEWSYDLLDENEKFLFRRLAVFAGGFTVEAAEAISSNSSASADGLNSPKLNSNGSPGSVRPPAADKSDLFALDLLASLVDNNLLVSKEQPDGNARLRMLEVVREFALECLEASGEADFVRRRHAEFFLALAEEAEPFLEGGTGNEWLEKLENDHDNIRAALRWCLKKDAPAAARIAAGVRAFWIDHSHHAEGLRWCAAALQATENSASEARLKLLATSGNLLRTRGELEAARKFHEKGLTESLELKNPLQILRNYFGLGVIAVLQKDYVAAQNFYQKALAVSRQANEETGTAYLLNALADLEMCQGNFSAARPLLEECLARSKNLDTERLLLTVYSNLGMVEFFENFYEAAASIFAETLRIAREMGNKIYVAYALDGFAALAAEAGNREQSAKLSGAAASLREEIGYKIEPAEEIFREKYLAQIRRALDEKQFAALYAQGRTMNSDEAVALARPHPAKSGASGYQFNQAFSESGGQSKIIIENHSFSRIVIEEENGDEPIYKCIETKVLKS